MSRYVVPVKLLEDYKRFIDAIMNTEPSKVPISITNSITLKERKIVFNLRVEKDTQTSEEKEKL